MTIREWLAELYRIYVADRKHVKVVHSVIGSWWRPDDTWQAVEGETASGSIEWMKEGK